MACSGATLSYKQVCRSITSLNIIYDLQTEVSIKFVEILSWPKWNNLIYVQGQYNEFELSKIFPSVYNGKKSNYCSHPVRSPCKLCSNSAYFCLDDVRDQITSPWVVKSYISICDKIHKIQRWIQFAEWQWVQWNFDFRSNTSESFTETGNNSFKITCEFYVQVIVRVSILKKRGPSTHVH
jgi:hypothetical protein